MSGDKVASRLRVFLQERFPPVKKIGDDDRMLGGGLVDSLGILDVVAFLEHEFGIAVDDDDLVPEHFNSISAMAAFVARKRGTLAPPGGGD